MNVIIDGQTDADIVLVSVFPSGNDGSADEFAWPEGQSQSLLIETGARILSLNYHDLVDKKNIHTIAGLNEAAQRLLDALMVDREDDPERPLAFICQDLAGIVVKNLFVLAAQNRDKYRSIMEQAYSIVFFGCPHRIPDKPNFIDRIALWLGSHSYTTFEGLFNTSRLLASNISYINGIFLDTGIMTQCYIANVVAEYPGTPKQVFSPFAVTLDIPMELQVLEPHSFLTLMFGERNKLWGSLQAILSSSSGRGTYFQFLEPPLLYPCQDELQNDIIDWVKESIAIDEWLETPNNRFLHLVGDYSHPASLLSHLKGQDKSNGPKRRIFYFCFQKYDTRLNNPTALLTTVITQALLGMNASSIRQTIEALAMASSEMHLSKRNLLALLMDLWVDYKQQRLPIVVVIWNLDGCVESLSWLVDAISNIETFSEALPQILFQSSGGETMTELLKSFRVLKKLPVTTVKGSPNPPQSGYRLRCELEVENLLRIQPSLGYLEGALSRVLARHRHHNSLDIAITQWVCRHVQSLVAIFDVVDVDAKLANLSNITTGHLITKMMETIPPHKLLWSRKILSWILVSFRPLTIWELNEAVYLGAISAHLSTTCAFEDDLRTCFSGLVTVENNEVCFVHPAVRQYLTRQECVSQAWYTSAAQAHFEVLQDLLAYFGRTKTAPLRSMPLRQDLKSYALAFLLSHYLKVRKSNALSASPLCDEVRGHLENFSKDQLWQLSATLEPHTTDSGSEEQAKEETSLHIAIVTFIIRHGRYAVTVRDLDELCPGWLENNKVIQAALVEAVLRNDTALVKALPIPPLKALDVSAVLKSVPHCDDPRLVNYLFNKMKKLEDFPIIFLKRAVVLAVDRAVTWIVENRTYSDDPVSNILEEFLLQAIISGETRVVGILTASMKKASQTMPLEALTLACRRGDPRSIDHILEGGFDMTFLEEVDIDEQPLNLACTYGNWKAVQRLAVKQELCSGDEECLWTSLRTAVGRGFVKCTTQLLAVIDPKSCSKSEKESLWEVLMHGIVQGQVETCRALLKDGVDPNIRETWQQEPVLSVAVRSENNELLRLLQKYKVPLEAKDSWGNTPIYLAAKLGLTDTVSLLIDEGANIDARADFGGTALYEACINDDHDMVKILLHHGADVRISTHEGNWSPLEAAYDYPKVLRLLVEEDVDYRRLTSGSTALWRAARDGCVESVEILLAKKGCEVDFYPTERTSDDNGLTALAIAVQRGHAQVARLLLEAGANVNHVNPASADFVLKLALNEEVLAVLLEYGPDMSMTDQVGNTALHCCALSNGARAVKRLINHKAEINALNKKKAIPLHYACQVSNIDAVKLLVKHGANVNASDSQHGTPLIYTCMSAEGQLEKIKYLVEDAGAEFGEGQGAEVLGMAALRSDMKTIEYLVEHGGRKVLDEANRFGCPPLFHACYRIEGALEMVEYLVEQGATMSDHRDIMGRTALHCAAVTHNAELVKKLIHANKELLDETDEDGWIPLHWAMRRADAALLNSDMWDNGFVVKDDLVKTVEALLDGDLGRRSRIATAGGRDWTPLKLARYHGLHEMVGHLLSPPAEDDSSVSAEKVQLYESPVAKAHSWACDACFCKSRGFLYKCMHETCINVFALCFKCIAHKDRLHNASHEFEQLGPEFESVQEDEQPDGVDVDVLGREASVEPVEGEAPTWDFITMETP